MFCCFNRVIGAYLHMKVAFGIKAAAEDMGRAWPSGSSGHMTTDTVAKEIAAVEVG